MIITCLKSAPHTRNISMYTSAHEKQRNRYNKPSRCQAWTQKPGDKIMPLSRAPPVPRAAGFGSVRSMWRDGHLCCQPMPLASLDGVSIRFYRLLTFFCSTYDCTTRDKSVCVHAHEIRSVISAAQLGRRGLCSQHMTVATGTVSVDTDTVC